MSPSISPTACNLEPPLRPRRLAEHPTILHDGMARGESKTFLWAHPPTSVSAAAKKTELPPPRPPLQPARTRGWSCTSCRVDKHDSWNPACPCFGGVHFYGHAFTIRFYVPARFFEVAVVLPPRIRERERGQCVELQIGNVGTSWLFRKHSVVFRKQFSIIFFPRHRLTSVYSPLAPTSHDFISY